MTWAQPWSLLRFTNFVEVTCPVFERGALERFLAKSARFKTPILIGMLPLHSYRHAEFIHNELPGVVIPESIRDRMREAGERGLEEGAAIAQETIQAAKGGVQGIYLIPAFGRYDVAAELVELIKADA